MLLTSSLGIISNGYLVLWLYFSYLKGCCGYNQWVVAIKTYVIKRERERDRVKERKKTGETFVDCMCLYRNDTVIAAKENESYAVFPYGRCFN